MRIKKLVIVFLFTIPAWAGVYNCKSKDNSGLLIEIQDSDPSVTFSKGSGESMVRAVAIKVFQAFDYKFQLSPDGKQITLSEKRQFGNWLKNRSGLKLNCTQAPFGFVCKSAEGKMEIAFKNDPQSKTPIMEITENLGLPSQSIVKTDSEVHYQTTLGMEVILHHNGSGVYSGSRRKGAIVDANALGIECR